MVDSSDKDKDSKTENPSKFIRPGVLDFDAERLERVFKRFEELREAPAQAKLEARQIEADAGREACEPLSEFDTVEYRFGYRHPRELMAYLDLGALEPARRLSVACVPISAGTFSLAADYRYNQMWNRADLRIGDLSATIDLAPAEVLTLNIKKTQRTKMTHSTMESSESLESFESSLIDKDVLNVTRSTSATQRWNVDGNATLSLGTVFTLGASGGLSRSTTATSNRNVQRISTATEKSARQLKSLQKIEVARESERLTETSQQRTITNPYRDRSLTLKIYELSKCFWVKTQLAHIHFCLVLEITDFVFDWRFVEDNGEFLDDALLDRSLANELRSALETVRKPQGPSQEHKAQTFAEDAFRYLFVEDNMFGLQDGERNNPAFSFSAYLNDSGLNDSLDNELGRVFATLSWYFKLYNELTGRIPPIAQDPPLPFPRPQKPMPQPQGIELAIALADALRTDWTNLSPSIIKNVMDEGDRTEVLRRVPGFLSMVDGVLKPLLKPVEEEREAQQASDRAAFVVNRVIKHLICNKDYYVQRYLEYMAERSRKHALASVVRDALVIANEERALEFFDPLEGFVDGFQYIVPFRDEMTIAEAEAVIDSLNPQPKAPLGGIHQEDEREISIPADGVHIEPVPGVCILEDVPEPAGTVETNIQIKAAGGPGAGP